MNTREMVVNAFNGVSIEKGFHDVIVMIQKEPAILAWQETISGFVDGLREVKIFSEVKVLGLCVEKDAQPELIDATGQKIPINELIDPTGRKVICILTTGAGSEWKDGRVAQFFMPCARVQPVVIGQMFSQHFWMRTAIHEPSLFVKRKKESGHATVSLRVRNRRYAYPSFVRSRKNAEEFFLDFFEKKQGPYTQFPFFGIQTPETFENWARAILGSVGETCAVALRLPNFVSLDAPDEDETEEIPVLKITNGFRAMASPEGFQLGVFCSAIKGSFGIEVLRCIQQYMLNGEAKHEQQLAEVLLGGIFRWVNRGDDFNQSEPLFAFAREDVRDALSRKMRISEVVCLRRILAEHFPEIIVDGEILESWFASFSQGKSIQGASGE